jgi:hypothetical protein
MRRRTLGALLAGEELILIAQIPHDRRATALTVTLLHKPQFSQDHGGATTAEKGSSTTPKLAGEEGHAGREIGPVSAKPGR